MRGETLSLRVREYVQAVRVMGGGGRRIVVRHIIPNTVGTIIVNATFQVADAILLLAALGFIGLGVPLPLTDWGSMLANAVQYALAGYWWEIYPTGRRSCSSSWRSTSSATRCATPSKSGSSAASSHGDSHPAGGRAGALSGSQPADPAASLATAASPSGVWRGKWHAVRCSAPTSRSGGSSAAQISCAKRAAGAEPAAARRCHRRGQLAPHDVVVSSPRDDRVRDRDRVDERLRVRVGGVLVNVDGRSDLDELAEVHDADRSARYFTTARSCEMTMYVRSWRCLQVPHQVEDLGLDRNVERRDRLVGDDELRVERERAREADPLALPAGELVRIELGRFRRTARPRRGARRHVRLSATVTDALDDERLPDDRPTRMRGSSEEYGSWKIICRSRRAAPQRASPQRGDLVDS